jgi:FKBP-type peptidyl-prolyl cis-trans isomerase
MRRINAKRIYAQRLRWLALVPVLFSALVSVTGCGSGTPIPTVTGSFGTDPAVAIPAGKPSGDLQVQTVIKGHGPVVRSNDYVIMNVEGRVWAGDRLVIDTYVHRQPQAVPLAGGMPAWRSLAGQQVGSRVLMVVPPKDGFGLRGNSQLNVMGGDTLVFVFDILRAVPAGAAAGGVPRPYQAGAGMPRVTWFSGTHSPGGHSHSRGPLITVPKAAPPKELVVKLLRRGTGPRILNGQTVAVQYTGVVWRTGKVFDSTWARGYPLGFLLGTGQMIPGWDQVLGGLPVGSRVLAIIPPQLAYGNAAQPPYIKSGDTLVYVIDIVAAVQG